MLAELLALLVLASSDPESASIRIQRIVGEGEYQTRLQSSKPELETSRELESRSATPPKPSSEQAASQPRRPPTPGPLPGERPR